MQTPSEKERRKFSRIAFDAETRIVQGEKTFKAQLLDISVNGVLLGTPQEYQLRLDQPCAVEIPLADGVEIHMQVSLIHSSPTLLGFQCTSIDMDSMIHLRRLVEMNMGDPAASDRVLSELLSRHGETK